MNNLIQHVHFLIRNLLNFIDNIFARHKDISLHFKATFAVAERISATLFRLGIIKSNTGAG